MWYYEIIINMMFLIKFDIVNVKPYKLTVQVKLLIKVFFFKAIYNKMMIIQQKGKKLQKII